MYEPANAPLYETVIERSSKNALRMHMPGHKGRSPFPGFADAFSIDMTELSDTGNLYGLTGPIREAEKLAAIAFGAPDCMFLTGGSTQGIMTALALCARGGNILMDRGCHRSVYNATALLDIKPEYIYPAFMEEYHVAQAISPETVDEKLSLHNDIKAVIITSPTYYGVISDVSEIAYVCRSHGAKLIVDGAHGAHLPFMAPFLNPVSVGASFAVMSGHKTLPVLTQGAYLFGGNDFTDAQIREAAAVFGTSSPSYPVMCSLDLARDYMQQNGRYEYIRMCATLDGVRHGIDERGVFTALGADIGNNLLTDPARFVLNTSGAGLDGHTAAHILENRFGVACEACDRQNVVFICTCMDSDGNLARLEEAVRSLERSFTPDLESIEWGRYKVPPVRIMTPREAYMTRGRHVPLKSCAGRMSLQNVGLYPPDIPVFARGEIIDGLHIEYLAAMRYNIDTEIYVK